MHNTLDCQILYPGAFSMAQIYIEHGQSIKAESGAMVAMTDTIDVDGKLDGGIFSGIKRVIAGEKFFFQVLTASRGDGEVLLSPSMPGTITKLKLDGSTPYIVQKDGFFASTIDVDITATVQNLAKGFLSGEGFFVIKASGVGEMLISSYGAIHEIDIPDKKEIIVDNNHLVAWPSNISWTLDKASASWVSTITSGEGIVCIFRGPGKIFIQSRNPAGLTEWLKTNISR